MTIDKNERKIYFKGLDTLRAIAALVVVVYHIEMIKVQKGFTSENDFHQFPDGHLGVILFFVLSGFLITYLLIQEQRFSESIDLKKFYIRRILRIWPLYYLILLLSYLILDADYSLFGTMFSILIFPNFAQAIGEPWQSSPQIWSIGLEEQFYLFWPLLIIFIRPKYLLNFLIFFIISYTVLPHIVSFIYNQLYGSTSILWGINKFFYGTKFNCMAIGGLIGFSLAEKKKFLNILTSNYLSKILFFLTFLLWFLGFKSDYFNDEIYALLFGIIILNVAVNEFKLFQLDIKPFTFVGKISFGIYMYHWLIIQLLISNIPLNYFSDTYKYNLILYSLSISLTIIISWLSFKYFESYFLVKKAKYEIKSE